MKIKNKQNSVTAKQCEVTLSVSSNNRAVVTNKARGACPDKAWLARGRAQRKGLQLCLRCGSPVLSHCTWAQCEKTCAMHQQSCFKYSGWQHKRLFGDVLGFKQATVVLFGWVQSPWWCTLWGRLFQLALTLCVEAEVSHACNHLCSGTVYNYHLVMFFVIIVCIS